MLYSIRLASVAACAALVTTLAAADLPKDTPFAPAPAASATPGDSLEFAGVSSVGSKNMINLYDRAAKHGFWVEEGKTDRGVTVVKYDAAHDLITIRQNGVEKTLPLRPPSAVVNGPVTPPITAIPANAPAAAAPLPPPTPTSQLSQARQEEEARMLVSDLLEIGMVQRRAYEEAQKKAAAQQAGGTPQPAAPAGSQSSRTAGAAAQPPGATPPATAATPSGG